MSSVNSDTLYLIVDLLIDDEKYKDVLEFLNIQKNINRLIEHKVLSNERLYQEGKIFTLPSKRINELTKELTNDIVSALNECQWFNVKSKQKEKIQKTIYEFLVKELENKNIVFYKGVGFSIPTGNQLEILSENDFEKIGEELLKVVSELIDSDCSTLYWRTDYKRRLKNNIHNVLKNTSNYSNLYQKSKLKSSTYKSPFTNSIVNRYRYGY